MRLSTFAVVVAVFCGIAGLAYAKGPLTGDIQAFVVSVDDDGVEKVTSADVTEPGQILEFQIVFTNNGDSHVNGIQVVDPIPENTRFIGDSHRSDVPAAFEVSIDGGESFEAEPVRRIETREDGTQQEVVITPDQYTHVRWLADEALHSNGGKHSVTIGRFWRF